MIIFRFYLPDPIALPTKEGGAELDVSGVWTFTPMSPETGINETGTSGTKLLQTPVRDLDVNPEAAMLGHTSARLTQSGSCHLQRPQQRPVQAPSPSPGATGRICSCRRSRCTTSRARDLAAQTLVTTSTRGAFLPTCPITGAPFLTSQTTPD